jgi:hypothetical protein
MEYDTLGIPFKSETIEVSWACFVTRPLREPARFTDFYFVIHCIPEMKERRIIFAVGWVAEGDEDAIIYTYTTVLVPSGVVLIEGHLQTDYVVGANQRLFLLFDSYEPIRFLWGDEARVGKVITNNADLQGLPIPEFSIHSRITIVVFMILLAFWVVRQKLARAERIFRELRDTHQAKTASHHLNS